MIQIEDEEIAKIVQETPKDTNTEKKGCCKEETVTNIKIFCIFVSLAWPVGRLVLETKTEDKFCSVCSSETENLIIWIVGAFWLCISALCMTCIAACLISVLDLPVSKQ
tara:strand:+ start:414 stop:740 length:327 start_codon:yes stop_codon:yes gene_type:complete